MIALIHVIPLVITWTLLGIDEAQCVINFFADILKMDFTEVDEPPDVLRLLLYPHLLAWRKFFPRIQGKIQPLNMVWFYHWHHPFPAMKNTLLYNLLLFDRLKSLSTLLDEVISAVMGEVMIFKPTLIFSFFFLSCILLYSGVYQSLKYGVLFLVNFAELCSFWIKKLVC